jgi:hypothetical protein
MRSTFDIVRHSVAVGALIVAVNMLTGGVPLAYGAPGCDGGCNITPSIPGIGGRPSTGQPSNNGGGSRSVQPGNPVVKQPPVPVVSNRPVIQKLPERPPAEIPPPDIPNRQPVPNIPVYTPPPPDVAPVVPAPIAVAPAPPAEIPVVAPPPSAPPSPALAPVPRVFFTNISEPMGTQSATLIVLFMACGCWIYGNRIASRMTERKTEHAPAGA